MEEHDQDTQDAHHHQQCNHKSATTSDQVRKHSHNHNQSHTLTQDENKTQSRSDEPTAKIIASITQTEAMAGNNNGIRERNGQHQTGATASGRNANGETGPSTRETPQR